MKKILLIVCCLFVMNTASMATTDHIYITVGEAEHSFVIDDKGNLVDFESIRAELDGSFYYENTIFPESKVLTKEMNGQVVEQMIYLFGVKDYKDTILVDATNDKVIDNDDGYLLLNGERAMQVNEYGHSMSTITFDLPEGSRITDVKKDAYIYELPNGAQGRISKTGEIIEYAEAARITYLDDKMVHYHVNMGLKDETMTGVYGVQLKDVSNGQTLVHFKPGTMGHKIGDNLFAGRNSIGQWYLIDYDGTTISERPVGKIPYVNIGRESQGLISFAVRSESGAYLWGYMDRTERVVIKPQFTRASAFNNDFAIVDVDGKKGLINRTGLYTILPEMDRIQVVNNNGVIYYSLKLNDYSGLMDQNFNWLVKPTRYTYANVADEGIYIVKKSNVAYLMGLLDHSGHTIIPCEFSSISKLDEHLFIVEKNEESLVFNKDTSLTEAFAYKKVRSAGYNYIAVSEDGKKWGLSTITGQLVTELKYDRIGMFRNYASKKVQ